MKLRSGVMETAITILRACEACWAPGYVGPPGILGRSGICPASLPENFDNIEADKEFGTKESPAEVPCKLAPEGATSSKKALVKKVKDDEKTCTTKYATCTLTIDGKPVMERGEKGDIGLPGLQGPRGDIGDRGKPGAMGFPGMPGMKGEPGVNGRMGLSGMPGNKGDRGENGKMGPAGPMGPPGPVGPPGPPGSHGVCPCYDTPNTIDSGEHDVDDDFGTLAWPAEVPCKSAGPRVNSGIYYLGPQGKPIQVFCNMTSLETCIRISKKTPECNHNPSKGAFWLNEMGVDMKELYYNISVEQLTWLRDRSESVRQTLKYNCLDSVPYSKHNMSSSVKLWAWNDVVIGPYPTNQSPIFYSVPEATDKCKEGSTEWKSTIIELQSSNVYRLPIVNMWIGDIRNAEQKMSIESVELCFG